jgi:hypothetical protein
MAIGTKAARSDNYRNRVGSLIWLKYYCSAGQWNPDVVLKNVIVVE